MSADVAAGLLLLLALALGAGAWYVVHGSNGSASTKPAQAAAPPAKAAPVHKKRAKRGLEKTRPERVPIPAVTGTNLDGARRALERAGLRVRVRTESSAKRPGSVLRQSPSGKTDVRPGSTVTLVVSSGRRPVVVTDVVGGEAAFAAGRLRDQGLRVLLERVPSRDAAGTVLSQSPDPGSRVPRGTTVRLRVATSAPRPVVVGLRVPDVVGLAADRARGRLETLGFRVRVVRVDSDRPTGEVVSESPDAGTRVRKGTRVTLGVSAGPSLVDVPDVTGMDEDAARSQLDQAGFDVSVVDQPTTDVAQDGIVTDQSPAGGGQAKQGATITITVARYQG